MHSLWFEQAFLPGSRAEKVRVDTSGSEIEAVMKTPAPGPGIPFGAPADIVSLATDHPAPTGRSRECAY